MLFDSKRKIIGYFLSSGRSGLDNIEEMRIKSLCYRLCCNFIYSPIIKTYNDLILLLSEVKHLTSRSVITYSRTISTSTKQTTTSRTRTRCFRLIYLARSRTKPTNGFSSLEETERSSKQAERFRSLRARRQKKASQKIYLHTDGHTYTHT